MNTENTFQHPRKTTVQYLLIRDIFLMYVRFFYYTPKENTMSEKKNHTEKRKKKINKIFLIFAITHT